MKEFLETIPLYSWLQFEDKRFGGQHKPTDIDLPNINYHCPRCTSLQTYRPYDDYSMKEFEGHSNNHIFALEYTCMGCNGTNIEFLLQFITSSYFDDEKKEHVYQMKVQKVGQFPAWSINIDSEVEKILGEELVVYYKKGIICESQGYGIGAFAYYRRITEDIIHDLLEKIKEIVPEGEEKDINNALTQIQQQHTAEKKIEIAKDVLPESLRPGNKNPLDVIYNALSGGLHAEDDQECLNFSSDIRESLTFLVKETSTQKVSKEKFANALDRLSKKVKKK